MGEQIRMKFSGLARLVCSNFWVGSTPAQSPQVGPGLRPVLLPEVEQVCGLWCYQDVSYHFRKLLSSQTTMAEQIFDFGAWGQLLRVGTPRGAKKVLRMWQFFKKHTPPKIKF